MLEILFYHVGLIQGNIIHDVEQRNTLEQGMLFPTNEEILFSTQN